MVGCGSWYCGLQKQGAAVVIAQQAAKYLLLMGPFSKPSARAVVLQRAPFPSRGPTCRFPVAPLLQVVRWPGFLQCGPARGPRAAFACPAAQEVDV